MTRPPRSNQDSFGESFCKGSPSRNVFFTDANKTLICCHIDFRWLRERQWRSRIRLSFAHLLELIILIIITNTKAHTAVFCSRLTFILKLASRGPLMTHALHHSLSLRRLYTEQFNWKRKNQSRKKSRVFCRRN